MPSSYTNICLSRYWHCKMRLKPFVPNTFCSEELFWNIYDTYIIYKSKEKSQRQNSLFCLYFEQKISSQNTRFNSSIKIETNFVFCIHWNKFWKNVKLKHFFCYYRIGRKNLDGEYITDVSVLFQVIQVFQNCLTVRNSVTTHHVDSKIAQFKIVCLNQI